MAAVYSTTFTETEVKQNDCMSVDLDERHLNKPFSGADVCLIILENVLPNRS